MKIDWSKYITSEILDRWFWAAVILVIVLIVVSILGAVVKRLLPKKFSPQRKMLINRFVRYTGTVILFIVVISELEVNLTAIFGAAGVIGIVIGVASQTSIGNIVSGFFLVSEKPFELGDLIRIGDKSGVV